MTPSASHNHPDKGRTDSKPQHAHIPGLWVALIGGLIVLALFAFGLIPRLFQNHKLNEEARTEKNALPQVVTVKPRPMPDADLTLPGTTEAIHDTVIASRTTGYISRLYADIGSHVKSGQLLAEIVAPDVDAQVLQGKQQTAQAVATVRQAESDVSNRRAAEVQTRSTVNQAEANVEQARAQLADAEAKLAQSRAQESAVEAQLAQQQQNVDIKRAALTQAKTQLDLTSVTLKRYQTLLTSGFVALQDVDQIQANYDNALSAVRSAEADLQGAQANVNAFQNQVKSARANVTSFQAEVTASQKNVRAVSATVNSAQAAVTAARANIQSSQAVVQANQANVRAAQANEQRLGVQRGFARVVAPFDGVITARNVDVGGLINGSSGTSSTTSSLTTNQGSASTSSGTPSTVPTGGLFGLASTDTLRILVNVPATYVGLIRPGFKADLNLPKRRGQTLTAEVHNVSGAVDAVSRTLLTELWVANKQQTLLPGMYVQVHFSLPTRSGALLIPSSALIFDAQGTRVATVVPGNKIHLVPIHVGRDQGTDIEVLEGLSGNETVVTNPNDDLVEGVRVDPKQAPPPPPAPPKPAAVADFGNGPALDSAASGRQGVAPNGANAQGQATGQQPSSGNASSGQTSQPNPSSGSSAGQTGSNSSGGSNRSSGPSGTTGIANQPGGSGDNTIPPSSRPQGQNGGTAQPGTTTPGGSSSPGGAAGQPSASPGGQSGAGSPGASGAGGTGSGGAAGAGGAAGGSGGR